jgi:hypothetical protein
MLSALSVIGHTYKYGHKSPGIRVHRDVLQLPTPAFDIVADVGGYVLKVF